VTLRHRLEKLSAWSEAAYNIGMATISLPPAAPSSEKLLLSPTADGRARFSREAYQRMYEAGVFGTASRVELLDGEIVMMSPIGPEHVALVSILTEFFAKHLPDTMQCRVPAPVVLSNHSEPEPDLVVVQRRADNYRCEHPSSANIMLITEVAQSSRRRDLDWKRRIYAVSSVAEYWVIDVDEQAVVIHREPADGNYQQVELLTVGRAVAPLCAPNCELQVGTLFA
jgi:Uma2 family endonuclease